jgi:hypothetical protein
VEGVCNAGLEFDLWHNVGSRFLDHVRVHAPGIATAIWPGEQRQLQRWLEMGLIDIAFCYVPHAGEEYTSRLLLEDELILVSARADQSAALDSSYIYVDHGDQFRRQHAEAFPEARPSPVGVRAAHGFEGIPARTRRGSTRRSGSPAPHRGSTVILKARLSRRKRARNTVLELVRSGRFCEQRAVNIARRDLSVA